MSRKRVDLLSIHESTRSNIVLIFVTIIIFLHVILSIGESSSDAEILLKFKESLRNTGALSNWDKAGSSPCNHSANIWNGVLCNSKGKVWGLKLEKMELGGVIDVDTLKRLPDLRTISVMYNQFEGKLPNLTKLGALKTIYLSNNGFSGELPATCFNRMMWLKKLHLANNKFEGPIPTTLAELPKLIELMLEKNEFTGQLPDFHQTNWQYFNASHNKLEGPIPASLSHFNASSFLANVELCGAPLQACPSQKRALSDVVIIVIVSLLVAGAFMALIAIVIILHRRKDSSSSAQQPDSDRAAPPPTGGAGSDLEQGRRQVAAPAGSVSSPDHHNSGRQSLKLTFLKDSDDRFDISDLLKASAEVLGSGALSSTYKASLFDGDKLMVVKRFKQMNNVGKEEFNEHMWRLGRLNHQNVLPLLAYYYRKEEKLLVMDYVENVSLAFQLHGNRSRSTTLDWPRRLNIIKGVANGLLYLNHELPSVTTPHGHLKSANVLLDRSFKPLLTDYGFVPVVNQDHAQKYMVCYKSPEFKNTGQVTRKTDVWSLGILILEILTGRFPSNLLQQGGAVDVDLAMWVDSVVRDGGMEVFDGDMVVAAGTSNNPSHGEMMKLLKIGLSCCQADLEQRPEIREALEKIEEIKEKDVNVDDEFYSSYASDADMRSSRGLSDDFKND